MKIFFQLILLIIIINSYGQKLIKIRGKIINENEEPIPGASVIIKETGTGIVTDTNGIFELQVPENELITLKISHIGYETINKSLKVEKDLFFIEKMYFDIKKIGDVKIIARKDISFERINIKTLKNIPVPGQNIEFLLGAMGAIFKSEFTSQYSIRGGNYDENLVYIDDVEIYRPISIKSGQQEGLSIINPEMISNIYFSAGGFSAAYGDKMASVLDIQYKRPDSTKLSFTGSFLGFNSTFEGITKKKNISIISSFRYKRNNYLLKNLETKADYKPEFYDLQTYLNILITRNLTISYLNNFTTNRYLIIPSSRETEFGTFQIPLKFTIFYEGMEDDIFNTYINAIIFKYSPSNKISIKIIGSHTQNIEKVKYNILGQYWINFKDLAKREDSLVNIGVGSYLQYGRNLIKSEIYNIDLKCNFYLKNGYKIKNGLNYKEEYINDKTREWEMIDSTGYSLPYTGKEILLWKSKISNYNLINRHFSGFILNEINLKSNKFYYNLNYGIRFHFWNIKNIYNIVFSPRIIINFELISNPDIKFYLATGYYYQPPFYKEFKDPEGNLHLNIKPQKSIHYLAGTKVYFKAWDNPFVFTCEAYYKHLWNLIPYKVEDVNIQYLPQYIARGYAKGIDFRLNGEFIKNAESWLSLTLLDTKEDIYRDYFIRKDKTVADIGFYRRPMDQRFNFTAFIQDYFPLFPDYKFFLSGTYGSRIPYGTPDYSRPDINIELRPYRRIDIGISRRLNNLWILKYCKESWLSFEIYNLFNLNNVGSYQWIKTISQNSEGLPYLFAVPNNLTGRIYNLKLKIEF